MRTRLGESASWDRLRSVYQFSHNSKIKYHKLKRALMKCGKRTRFHGGACWDRLSSVYQLSKPYLNMPHNTEKHW